MARSHIQLSSQNSRTDLSSRSGISVVAGDRHFGAPTSSGKLLTWSKYSRGALGLEGPGVADSLRGYAEGERAYTPPDVTVPMEVRFQVDHHERLIGEGRVQRHCFAVAACANHTAALVVDLAGDEVPPEDLNQTRSAALVRPWCMMILDFASCLADSTAQSAHDPHIGPARGDANLPTHIYFV